MDDDVVPAGDSSTEADGLAGGGWLAIDGALRLLRRQMSKAKSRHTRKRRRQTKAVMKHGPSAKPTHKLQAGRTGSLHAKKTKPRAHAFIILHPGLDLGALIELIYAVR